MRLRLANSAMRRTLRSSSSPISRKRAVAFVELAAAARRKHRDDDVGHLRDLRHQRQHRFARHLDHAGVSNRAHRHRPGAAVQKSDLAHELRRTERGGQMAFVGIGIDHLDLAFLDIDKAIRRFAGPREKRTRRIGRDLARLAQRLNVRCGQRDSLHFA